MGKDIFRVENDELVLDKDYLRGIPEFKAILERDKGSKGDADGRRKLQAFKELYYIYMIASLFSYVNKGGYNDKDKHTYALKESGLEDNFKVDSEIKKAIEKYRELQLIILPTLNTISTVLRGLKVSDNISKTIINNIEYTLELNETKKKEIIQRGETPNIAEDMLLVQGLVAQLDQLMSIANKLPKTIQTLEQLEERLSKEEAGENLARGGHTIGNRAD